MNKSTHKEKVIIIEDDRIVRDYLNTLILNSGDFVLEAEFQDAESALKYTASPLLNLSNIIFMVDINLPKMSGIDFVNEINRSHDSNCVMLTVFDDDKHIFEAIKAGAIGYVLKHDGSEKILEALRSVKTGGSPINSRVARRILKEFASIPNHDSLYMLTFREKQVIDLLARGLQLKEVATRLFITIDTVKTHVKNIYKKLQVSSKKQAVAYYNKK